MSSMILIGVFGFLTLLLLSSGMWIAVALGSVGIITLSLWLGMNSLPMVSLVIWNALDAFIMAAVPLFIFMGFLLMESRLSTEAYAGITPLLDHVPGGLLHSNIAVGTLFAACTGSSVASAATIGTMALPEMEKRGYQMGISMGSIAAGGVLAPLIPPSITFIVYGLITDVSIGKLFMAGVFPGLVLAALFSLYIAVAVKMRPEFVTYVEPLPLRHCLVRTVRMWPILALIVIVLGSIYLGVATPTESAAVGCVGAMMLAAMYRNLNWQMLKAATRGTVRVTSMCLFIYMGGKIMTLALANLGVPAYVTSAVITAGVSPWLVFFFVFLLYTVLGMIMDGFSMIVMTLPTIFPVMMALGYDPVWFGVQVTMLVELALLTPPVGMNLFVLQSLRPDRPFKEVVNGTLPFAFVVVVAAVLLAFFPQLALYLPGRMK